jgi:tellurite resistance protein
VLDLIDPAGIAVFVAAAASVVWLSNSKPTQWGIRRTALGILICAASIAAASLTESTFWYAGLFAGGYQIYVGWGFISRRSHVTHERRQYVTATARVLSYVALADGMTAPDKSQIIRDAYASAGFSADEVAEAEMAVRECEQAFVSNGSAPERLFDSLKDACERVEKHSDNQTRFMVVRTALKIAASDGFVSLAEEKMLRAATQWLGLTAADIDAAWREMFGETSATAATTSPVYTASVPADPSASIRP